MGIVRWEPFGSIQSAFNRMPSVLGRWPRLLEDSDGAKFERSSLVDSSETEKEYLFRAALPAVKKEDVRITVYDGKLRIIGERTRKHEEKHGKLHRVKSIYGSFSRSFSLPESVDAAVIRAELKDGIITVHVPKTKTEPKKQPTEVKVQ